MREPDTVARFDDRAADYARYRPGYPAAAVAAILDGLGDPRRLVVADVAAGTGILSRLLADRGARVVAIEPNAAMRAAATAHPGVEWRDGTAERTGLADASVDVVTAAQAFHWFEVAPALREFRRALRPGGRLALVWNRRRLADPFTRGYRRALEAIDAEAPAERSRFDPAVVAATGLFAAPREVRVPNAHPLTEAQLIGRAMSTSTVPRQGPRADELIGRLRELHRQHRDGDGVAAMQYDTEVFLWQRPA